MRILSSGSVVAMLVLVSVAPLWAADKVPALSQNVDYLGGKIADFKEGSPNRVQTPVGAAAVHFAEQFSLRVDLKPQGIESRQFDLIKLEVKVDHGAFMRVAVENHPRIGDISYWYVLDGMRGPLDWHTIWIDLARPEEVKAADDHRSPWREGMKENSADQRGVQIQGAVKDLKSRRQGPGRNVWLGPMRFVKQAVQLDWDQAQAPHTYRPGEDLVYRYPLTLTNKLDRPVEATVEFRPVEVEHAVIRAEPASLKLAAGETQTVTAIVSLPAKIAAEKAPLYCERFLALAKADGIEDSDVTILRSSDPIHLTITVPIDEAKLKLPLFARPSELPEAVLRFDEQQAREHAARDPQVLIQNALKHGLYQYQSDRDEHHTERYRQTLLAAAYLYDLQGDEKCLATAKELLKALPQIWQKWYAEYEQEPVRIISSGVVARWNDKSHFTLGLGWLVMGTQRSPYYYGISGNGQAASMGALAYAFDIIAPQLDEASRQAIIHGFFVPAGIQSRNHYIGDGNQQMTADLTAMYAGLLARNWPLVSFGYSSQHGFQEVLASSFDDDGVQLRKNYQTYTIRPIFWACELLHGAGVNVYQQHRNRLEQVIHADTQAKNMGGPFQDHEFWEFVVKERLK